MFKIGIIGAGTISENHLDAYKANSNCEVIAIADINADTANQRAKQYDIPHVYSDYRELLADKSIDAVSVVTPTFTHKDIIIDSLKKGKHVLCEKPPAMTADEVRECVKTAKECGKFLMFGFVCRFRSQVQYLKSYINNGKMGSFASAECGRVSRHSPAQGWFACRQKGGGMLMDAAIHEVDCALYLMGYPKPKVVLANQTYINNNLCSQAQPSDNFKADIESAISGYVTLDNGASLSISAASSLNALKPGIWVEISGEKAGARIEPLANNRIGELKILELNNDNVFSETKPLLTQNEIFHKEINHFIDCCVNGTECICKNEEAVILMEIINAMYKSADTGMPVVFDK